MNPDKPVVAFSAQAQSCATPCCAGKGYGQKMLAEIIQANPTVVVPFTQDSTNLQAHGAQFLANYFQHALPKAVIEETLKKQQYTIRERTNLFQEAANPCPAKVAGRNYLIGKLSLDPAYVTYDTGVHFLVDCVKAQEEKRPGAFSSYVLSNKLTERTAVESENAEDEDKKAGVKTSLPQR